MYDETLKIRILAVLLDIKANKCVLRNHNIHHSNIQRFDAYKHLPNRTLQSTGFLYYSWGVGMRGSLGPAATAPDDE